MKRFLSLLLALLLCFGFVVSCEKEEEPSSSSSQSSSSESSSSENLGLIVSQMNVDYYYRTDTYILPSEKSTGQSNIHMVYDREELLEKVESLLDEPLTLNNHMSVLSITDQMFEENYVFVIEEYDRPYLTPLMGYRNVTKTEDGYILIMDMIKYTNIADESINKPSNDYCYALVIPKSEFEAQPSAYEIQIKRVVYNALLFD